MAQRIPPHRMRRLARKIEMWYLNRFRKLNISIRYMTSAKVSGQTRKTQAPEIHGFDTANLDKSQNACHDFYQYAAGGWMATHPIPAAYPQWGSFVVLRDKNADVLHSILEDAS